jgi:acyl-CoA thioesterase-1
MNRTAVAALRAIFASALLILCAVSVAAPRPTVLVLGDSLSSAYGLPRESGWVKLLADRLASPFGGGGKYSVVNASIAGETTSGGRTRLPALLKEHRPEVVVIELGGNDALRGLSLAAMRDNLAAMTAASRAAGAKVLLIGMQVPPNYGPEYAMRFASTFAEIARAQKAALVPFLLVGFADRREYFQSDGIHPNERAQSRMLETVWPVLRPLLTAGKSPG